MALASEMELGLRIVGDSKQAQKAIEDLDKELESLGDSSEQAKNDLELLENQEEKTAATSRTLGGAINEVGARMKSIGGEIKAFGGELTALTAPFTIIAGLSLKNVFDLGKTDQASDTIKEFSSSITVLMSQFRELTTEIGTVLAPIFIPIINSVTNIILYFKSLDSETKVLIGTISLIVSALGPFLIVLGALVTAIGIAAPAVTALGSALAGLVSLIASPIAVISALALGVAGLVNVFLKLKEAGVSTADAIRDAFMLFITAFNKYVLGSILFGVQKIIQGLSFLTSFVSQSMADSISKASDAIGEIVQGLDVTFDAAKERIDSKLEGIGSSAGQAFTFGLSKSIPGAIDSIGDALSDISAKPIIEETRSALDQLRAKSEEVYVGLRDGLLNGFTEGIDGMVSGTKTLTQAFNDMTRSILKDIQRIIIRQAVMQGLSGAGFSFSASPGFATGGYVSGPGSGTSDSINARLSNGEFVLRASAVKDLGVGFLNRLNSIGGAALKSKKPNHFANGGLVTGGNQKMSVEIINSGADKSVRDASFNPESMVLSVVLEDLNKNGSISKGISSTFGIKRGNMR